MPTRLLLLLCLTAHVFPKKPPDVKCLVLNLEYVRCTWNEQSTPEVNYTFSSWFQHDVKSSCVNYLSENGVNTGCIQPYEEARRFNTFHTELVHGNDIFLTTSNLKTQVILNPPTNLTVKNGSDFNLWFYWNHTRQGCVENAVRYRVNNKKWEYPGSSTGRQSYCISLPSSSSRYELQVHSRVHDSCGQSEFWSQWSEPAVWGSNNSTDPNQMNGSMSVGTPVLYVVGATTLVLMVIMLLYHERLRIIPVVPKPYLIPQDIEDWFQFSKGLKESFKVNFNERACPVREYSHVSQNDSESSDSSTSSVTTNQTECSTSITVNDPEDLSTPFTSPTSTVSSEEERQGSV